MADPTEKIEFEFPDEKEEASAAAAAAAKGKDGDGPEVEIVDDTPPADRNRKVSTPPTDPTDDELKSYSEDVQQRIKHFTKGYHDERRAKETAARERDEAVRIAQAIAEENKKLKGTLSDGQNVLLEQTKKTVDAEVAEAKRLYKEAYESFDADAVSEAQEKLLAAKIKQDRLNNFSPAPLQEEKKEVQPAATAQPAVTVDPKALAWQEKNQWFGQDDEMTSYALGLHRKLLREGVNTQSEEYYKRLDARMRQLFPENFGAAPAKETTTKSPVVASATRSTAPQKIVLTQTQVALAKKLGVPLEAYAKQVAIEARKQNG